MRETAKAIIIQILVALIVLGVIAWLAHSAPFLSAVEHTEDAIQQWGRFSGLIYPLLVAATTVLLLPGGVLSLAGGFFFGLWWGTALVLLGNLIGAAIAFLIARFLGRKFIRARLLEKSKKWSALDDAIGRNGPRLIFFSQLNPLFPISLFNYLYGVTNVGFWQCILWVALGRIPGIFLYCYLGTLGQLGIRLLRGETDPGMADYLLWGGGLLLTLLVAVILGHTATRIIKEARGLTND